jgi:hypothetical protein
MQDSLLSWVVEHKEWSFATVCTVSGGVFAFIKWLAQRNRQQEPRTNGGARVEVEGSQNNLALIAAGTAINAPVIIGSNNVQSFVMSPSPDGTQVPIRQRKPTSPTGNEIRQKEESVLEGIPLTLQGEVQKRLWDSYLHINIGWPIRLYKISTLAEINRLHIQSPDDEWVVEARYGEESWGAKIYFSVKVSDYPILKTVGSGHRAFAEGHIKRIDSGYICLEVSRLEVE